MVEPSSRVAERAEDLAPQFPFTAIVGHDEFKSALLLTAVDPAISGVLALGDRGTGKSTLIRSLADLLRLTGDETPVVDLPLGATEDRVVGALDVHSALVDEQARFRPGLLAEADRGYLYIDEVNLLDDFLVDLLLDVAASGSNIVERDGISHRHPARFVLIGSGNPEEGRLRPQLEDRFGLSTHVTTITDVGLRTQVVRRRLRFDADAGSFVDRFAEQQRRLAERIAGARRTLESIDVDDDTLAAAVRVCAEAGAVGHRGEMTLIRAARAHAALSGHTRTSRAGLRAVAPMVLRHRVPRDAFEKPTVSTARVINAVTTIIGHAEA